MKITGVVLGSAVAVMGSFGMQAMAETVDYDDQNWSITDTVTLGIGDEVDFNVTPAATQEYRILVGNGDGTTGILNLDGGTLDMNIQGAQIGRMWLGYEGSEGTVNHTSGNLSIISTGTSYGGIAIGRLSGTGTYNQSGGVVSVGGGALTMGTNAAEASGTYNLTNSGRLELGTGSTVYIGHGGGTGSLNIRNNAQLIQGTPTTNGGQVYIGAAGGEGTITQQDASVVYFKGNSHGSAFWVGGASNEESGTGTYNLEGGSLTFENFNIRWGNGVGSLGVLNQSDGTLTVKKTTSDSPTFGSSGRGEFHLSGGTATFESGIRLASNTGSVGIVNVTGTGVLEVGGTNGIAQGNGSAAFTLGGGTLRVLAADLTTTVVPVLEAGTTSTIDTNGFNATLRNGFTGDGGFDKIGPGALILGGISTLKSDSTVRGLLQIGGGNNTGTLTVDSDLTLVIESTVGRIQVGVGGGTGTLNLGPDGSLTIDNSGATGGSWGTLDIGRDAQSIGTFTQTGGSVDVGGGALQIGVVGGIGTYDISGESSVKLGSGSTIYLGQGVNGRGTMNFKDDAEFIMGTPVTSGGQIFIASGSGDATITQEGDSVVQFKGNGPSSAFYVGGANDSDSGDGVYHLQGGSLSFEDLNIRWGNGASGVGILNQSNGTLTVKKTTSSAPTFGVLGRGEFNLSGGTATFESGIRLASGVGSRGTVNVTDTGILEVGGTDGIVKGNGTAEFNLGGGTLRAITQNLTTKVVPILIEDTISTVDTNGLNVTLENGFAGDGGFDKIGSGALILGGTSVLKSDSTVNGLLQVGSGSHTGTLTVDSDLTIVVDSIVSRVQAGVNGGNGTINLGAGASLAIDDSAASGTWGTLDVGRGSNSVGAFNQSGGQVGISGGALQIGYEGGAGTYNLAGTSSLTLGSGSTVYIGQGTNGVGTLDIKDGAQLMQGTTSSSGGQVFIGSEGGAATITQSDNTVVSFKGNSPGSAFWVGGASAGDSGEGTYNLQSGSLEFEDFNIRWGNGGGGVGVLNQSGGTLLVKKTSSATPTFGSSGRGEFNLSNGTATFENGIRLANGSGSEGIVNISGGVMEVGGTNGISKGSGTAEFNLAGGTLRVINENLTTSVAPTLVENTSSTLDTQEYSATLNQGISGSGALVKVGEGTLIINGVGTAETIEVEQGILSGTGSISGDVFIGSDAYLDGSLSVGGTIYVEGTHRPGFSPSAVYSEGNYEIASSGTLVLELGGTDGGTGTYSNPTTGDFDQILFGGDLTLWTGATILIEGYGGYGPELGDTFLLAYSAGSITLGDVNLVAGTFGYEFSMQTVEAAWNGVGRYDALQLTVTAVPEPSTVLMMLFGVLLLVGTRCRKRRILA